MICIKKGFWKTATTGLITEGPKYGEQVEVLQEYISRDTKFYVLKGYHVINGYAAKYFVDPDISELIEVLEVEERFSN